MNSTTTPEDKTGAGDPTPEMTAQENASAPNGEEEDFATLLDQSMEKQKVEVGEVDVFEVSVFRVCPILAWDRKQWEWAQVPS